MVGTKGEDWVALAPEGLEASGVMGEKAKGEGWEGRAAAAWANGEAEK